MRALVMVTIGAVVLVIVLYFFPHPGNIDKYELPANDSRRSLSVGDWVYINEPLGKHNWQAATKPGYTPAKVWTQIKEVQPGDPAKGSEVSYSVRVPGLDNGDAGELQRGIYPFNIDTWKPGKK